MWAMRCFRSIVPNVKTLNAAVLLGNRLRSTGQVGRQVFRRPPVRGISDYGEMFYKRLCAEEIGRKFEVSHDQLMDIQRRMTAAVDKGLGKSTHSAASVKCWDAHVDYPVCDAAAPRHVSEFFGLDVSHATRIETRHTTVLTHGRRTLRINMARREYPSLKNCSGRELFDRAAEQLAELAAVHEVDTTGVPLQLTVGFPVRYTSLSNGVLHRWTKEFAYRTDLLCSDVVAELRDSLARVHVRVGQVAVLNDVTVALLDSQVTHPNARVGLVVDDGCNCCFVDRVANVRDRRIEGKDAAAVNTIVNTEWGAFGENGELDDLRTVLDRHLDDRSKQPGKQIFEKLTSGMYMGELVRQFAVALANDMILFQGLITPAMNTEYVLNVGHLIKVESDARESYTHSREVLSSVLGICNPSDMDCALFRYASESITKRSAHLVGAALASVVQRLHSNDPENVVDIAAIGPVFSQFPRYKLTMMCKLKDLTQCSGSILPQSCSVLGPLRVAQLLAQVT